MQLTHKIMFGQIDLEATKLFKFSGRPGLRRSSLRLLQQTGRARRRRNTFACRVVKYWNRLPLAEASVQDHLAFKRQLDNYIYPYILLLSLFSPQHGLFLGNLSFPDHKIHTYIQVIFFSYLKIFRTQNYQSFGQKHGRQIKGPRGLFNWILTLCHLYHV